MIVYVVTWNRTFMDAEDTAADGVRTIEISEIVSIHTTELSAHVGHNVCERDHEGQEGYARIDDYKTEKMD